MIKNKFSRLITFLACATALSGTAIAAPTEEDQLLVETSASKRAGETAFSYLVAWRKDDASQHRANGLVFVNGSKTKNPTSAIGIARKTVKSLNAAINYDSPHERGAISTHVPDKAEILLSNKVGFDITYATVRDYSNQTLRYSIPKKSFTEASVDVSIDLVYSAIVEYLDGFSKSATHKAAGGVVKVTIDNNAPIEIKTEGKTVDEIEKELAKALGSKATFSTTPIHANYVESRSRNYKSFDGGEVQLLKLDAKSITIDVDDPALGVLTKFNYPDVNQPADVANKVPYFFGLLVAGILGYLFYIFQIKPKKEEIEE